MARLLVPWFGVFLSLFGSRAFGVEIYSLYGPDCQETTGAIVYADDDTASMLTLAGDIKAVKIAGVQLAARYDILENPFAHIGAGAGQAAVLDVTSESSEGSFQAYASSFVEDLVLFLDVSGKIRVVEMDEISSIKRLDPKDESAGAGKGALTYHPITLLSPPGRAECPAEHSAGDAGKQGDNRAATQVMADKLRINSFFARMRSGYRDLESLRERTLFYARPIMYDEKTRLGLVAVRTDRYDKLPLRTTGWDSAPIYLDFGSGTAYRFQGSTSVGTKSWRMAPQVKPIGALRSEFKSHLLHGIFLGNLDGFTAGKPLFINGWTGEEPDVKVRTTPWMDSSFNHLTLLGADYGRWSISYGYYFPSFALGEGHEFREVTSTNSSPVFRFAFTPAKWQVELFLFNTYIDDEVGENDPNGVEQPNQMRSSGRFVRFYSERFVPSRATLASTTARVSSAFIATQELTFQADALFTKTTYHETAFRRDVALQGNSRGNVGPPARRRDLQDDDPSPGGPAPVTGGDVSNRISQQFLAARLGARMDLGKWVALGAETAFERMATKGAFQEVVGAADKDVTEQFMTYSVMMELLL